MKSENNLERKKEELEKFTDRAKDKAEEMLKRTSQEIAEKYAHMEECVINYIQKNPWKSVGYSILGGIILANLFKK